MSKKKPTKSKATEAKPGTLIVMGPEKAQLALIEKDFEEAKRFWHGTKLGIAIGLFGGLMTGLRLAELKKKYGVRRGGDRRSKGTEFALKWEDIVQGQMGFSDKWADNLIRMAAKSKKLIKELGAAHLLKLSADNIKPEQQEKLQLIFRKHTDADTITELLVECGILKRPKLTGGGPGRPVGTPNTHVDEEVLARKEIYNLHTAVGRLVGEEFEIHLKRIPLEKVQEPKEDHDRANLREFREQLHEAKKAVDRIFEHRHAKEKKGHKAS